MSFEDARDFLNNIRAINWGGCAISAIAMYEWLKKNNKLSDDIKLVYLYWHDSIAHRTNKKYFSGKIKYAGSCEHACLLYNGVLYDSNGVVGEERLSGYDERDEISFTEMSFIRLSLNSGEWNTAFDRDENIPRIEKILGINLSEYLQHL